jgi:hypothetical protein
VLVVLAAMACTHNVCAADTGFTCARVVPSEIYQPPYGRIGDSNVCEGYYDKTVSRPFFELISLTAIPPKSIAALTDIELRISTPTMRQGATNLLIQPFSVAKPYRVDALISSPTPLPWNSGQLRQATNSTLQDVGFVAIVASTDTDPHVAPVRVFMGTTPGIDPVNFAYATVRVSVDATRFQWRSYPTLHSAASPSLSWVAIGDGRLYSEEWATVEIAVPRDGGNTTVEFTALDSSNSEFRPLRFVVIGTGHATH